MTSHLPDDVRRQIAAVGVAPDRPLIIADADEVLVVFMAAFEAFMEQQGLYFDWADYRLTGNIRRQSDRQPVDQEAVSALLAAFYDARAGALEPVPGAAEALAGLSRRARVVVLSNLPAAYGEVRRRSLAGHGMAYPVVVNRGPKGPAVGAFTDALDAPAFFIDDAPSHHASVADHAAGVHRLHFVHDRRLAALIGPARASHHRTDNWTDARAVTEARLDESGF
jgi:hypothetical protein